MTLKFESDKELFEYVMEHGPAPLPRDREIIYSDARSGYFGEALDTYVLGVYDEPKLKPLLDVIRDNIELLEWSYGVDRLEGMVGARPY